MARCRIRIAVPRVVCALVCQRERVARRRHELHHVAACRRYARERIRPVRARGRRRHHRQRRIQQPHRRPRDPRLARILEPVPVQVVPHKVANGARPRVQEVVARGIDPARQRDGNPVVVRRHDVARRDVAKRIRFHHRVLARRQVREDIAAIRGRGGRRHHRQRRIQQRDGHPRDSIGVWRIKRPVAVDVLEHRAANLHPLQHYRGVAVLVGAADGVRPPGGRLVGQILLNVAIHVDGDRLANAQRAEIGRNRRRQQAVGYGYIVEVHRAGVGHRHAIGDGIPMGTLHQVASRTGSAAVVAKVHGLDNFQTARAIHLHHHFAGV